MHGKKNLNYRKFFLLYIFCLLPSTNFSIMFYRNQNWLKNEKKELAELCYSLMQCHGYHHLHHIHVVSAKRVCHSYGHAKTFIVQM